MSNTLDAISREERQRWKLIILFSGHVGNLQESGEGNQEFFHLEDRVASGHFAGYALLPRPGDVRPAVGSEPTADIGKSAEAGSVGRAAGGGDRRRTSAAGSTMEQ